MKTVEEELLQIQKKLDKCFQKIDNKEAATLSPTKKKQLLCNLGSQTGMLKTLWSLLETRKIEHEKLLAKTILVEGAW
jgi:hypothetical protein